MTKTRSLNKTLYFSAAAVVLMLLSWTSLSIFNNHNTITHKTNFGEIIDLKLPDGTSVVLNGNSEIFYEKDNPRFINLKGEAYFKVKTIPSTNAKFWVITNDLKVEVLGTQFHVNTREQKTNVVLDEGSIHLEFNNGDVTKMIPGEMVSFSNKSNEVVHKKEIPISGGIPNQNLKICIAAIEKATGTRIINKGNILQVQENPIY